MTKTETRVEVRKVAGGFEADGVVLLKGKCGCTSLARCCYSWTKVKKKGNTVEVTAKLSDPDTKDLFHWSYTVTKAGVTVRVTVEDARDKVISAGVIPPPVSVWEARGWSVVEKSGDREDGVVWRCAMCKWLYKEDEEGRPFTDLPGSWKCPTCGVGKEQFERIG